MLRRHPFIASASLFALAMAATHCAASDASPDHGGGPYGGYDGGGSAGTGGSAGSGGSSGGSAGIDAGSDAAGAGGTAGSAGAGGSGGTDGGTDGSAGSGGTSGSGGTGGTAGSGGTGGTGGADAGAPYTHTITIDGTNDFSNTAEKFTTTSSSYSAYITWDASALYVGYEGTDIGTSASGTKWVLIYLDTDPGSATGATTGETYTTEAPGFPSGFGAEYYYGWKTDGSFEQYKSYSGSSWTDVTASGITHAKGGNFVEFRIPLSAVGNKSAKLGVVTLMMNQQSGAEASYAGLYSGSFTDGYHATVPINYYLQADFTSSLDPNDQVNRKP